MASFLLHILTTLLLSVLKVICLLIAIAYFTLAERKIMAAVQRRVGPNVVGPLGLLQPLADGLKLAGKELAIPAQASSRIFLSVAITVLLFALSGWSAIPFGMFDHSEYMSNSSVAKVLLLTEPSLLMYHTTLECYYAAPESRGFLRFWNSFEEFFKERGQELLCGSVWYDTLPAMLASKDPFALTTIARSFYEDPVGYYAMEGVSKMFWDWFHAVPWTTQEMRALLDNMFAEDYDTPNQNEIMRITQRRIQGRLHEPLFPLWPEVEAYYNAYAEMYEPDGEGEFRLRPGVHETPSPLCAEVEEMSHEGYIRQLGVQEVQKTFKKFFVHGPNEQSCYTPHHKK